MSEKQLSCIRENLSTVTDLVHAVKRCVCTQVLKTFEKL